MPTPDEEIKAFLSGGDAGDSRRLEVATLFAQSMLRELRSSVAEWEAAAVMLDEARAVRRGNLGRWADVQGPTRG